MDGGQITFNDMAPFSDTGEFDGKVGHLSDMCILVAHPKGWLLWDTGVQPKKYDGFEFTRKRTLSSQLADIGLKPEDITYLAFSHFHFDHTGNANEFLSSTWILQNKELQWANSQPTPFGVDPSTFSQSEKVKKQMIDGDHDVFGDGKVKILSAPGHTPGHEVLLIKLDSGKNLIFAGDLYHQSLSRDKRLVPAFNISRADTLASIDRVNRIAKNLNAKLFIQHEKSNFDMLPSFPKYLK
ncbi:N-acyl homoserine lactonase family protein [Pedosphaera parvula]|uniref:N-acyl homoserine lactonase family protein n=1 Tax=Pedosphaera parvula TaxID=1032527 RepID=UPI00135F14A2|nr:N-acyl homoserine lactonase family protein [Pedosphaera parvula]